MNLIIIFICYYADTFVSSLLNIISISFFSLDLLMNNENQ